MGERKCFAYQYKNVGLKKCIHIQKNYSGEAKLMFSNDIYNVIYVKGL